MRIIEDTDQTLVVEGAPGASRWIGPIFGGICIVLALFGARWASLECVRAADGTGQCTQSAGNILTSTSVFFPTAALAGARVGDEGVVWIQATERPEMSLLPSLSGFADPMVVQAEIKSFLANPEMLRLDARQDLRMGALAAGLIGLLIGVFFFMIGGRPRFTLSSDRGTLTLHALVVGSPTDAAEAIALHDISDVHVASSAAGSKVVIAMIDGATRPLMKGATGSAADASRIAERIGELVAQAREKAAETAV